jgi:hypothetical protein
LFGRRYDHGQQQSQGIHDDMTRPAAELGGPLAVKPPSKAGKFVPQSQVYLVRIRFVAPDATIYPGTLGQVKIHCKWRTCAWWVYRTVAAMFDIRLM